MGGGKRIGGGADRKKDDADQVLFTKNKAPAKSFQITFCVLRFNFVVALYFNINISDPIEYEYLISEISVSYILFGIKYTFDPEVKMAMFSKLDFLIN